MSVAAELLLLLGGNEGDPPQTFQRAEQLLQQRLGGVLAKSRDHWTRPWGFTHERLFLNRALLVRTTLPPRDALEVCLGVEKELGRTRKASAGYSGRTIDIDILLIGDHIIKEQGLEVPHPRMHERAFALAPAADIVPDMDHPILRMTILELLNQLGPASH